MKAASAECRGALLQRSIYGLDNAAFLREARLPEAPPLNPDRRTALQKNQGFALQKSKRESQPTPAAASPEQTEQFVLQKHPSAPPRPEFALQKSGAKPFGTPRNARCPCGSNQKHKRCCGKDAPPRLQAA